MSVADGPDGDVYLPVIYATDDADCRRVAPWPRDRLAAGRGGPVRGVGQRLFLVGEEAVAIMDLGNYPVWRMSGRGGTGRPARPTARVQLPLLDRLIDDAPDQERDPPMSAAEAMAALRNSVRRDLEALLNARRRWRSWPARLTELASSPLGYGIPDFAAGAFNDAGATRGVCAARSKTRSAASSRASCRCACTWSTPGNGSRRRCACASRPCCMPIRRPSRSPSTRWSIRRTDARAWCGLAMSCDRPLVALLMPARTRDP